MSTRVAVLGATGRVGRLVLARVVDAPDLELVAAVARTPGADAGALAGTAPIGLPVAPIGPGCIADADVVIDFSLPEALAAALPHLGGAALVTGTTGLDPATADALAAHAGRAPVLAAANFSVGIALLLDLVARAAGALPDWDLEIVEAHHRHKRDAPSGTALALGRAAAEARGTALETVARHGRHGAIGARAAAEIGFHAIRGGGITGDHTVSFIADGERIDLSHVAFSRGGFADGAIRAARWLAGRPPGTYTMAEVLFGP